jgi:tRNA-2-methylthio-N6-dimethylallyladenosine synthase
VSNLVQIGKKPPEEGSTAVSAGTGPRSISGPEESSVQGHRKRLYVETYGCQMNVADTDLIGGILANDGFVKTARAEDADVILINTCAVREKAEERVVARAAELSALKRKQPNLVLGIVGCMAEHLKEGLADRAPGVDVIAGPDSYRRMPQMLAQAAQNVLTAKGASQEEGRAVVVVDVRLDKAETYEGVPVTGEGDGVSAMVTIQRGCDKFCTFCVVPFTRGRERGAAPREILQQVRQLVARGYREVTLLGQTVNSYVYEDVTFAQLLRAVAKIDGLERIRFTSPYPVDFSDDVIAAIAEESKVCKYVHLPVQSGSDAVLARMKRGYTVADYLTIVDKLRAAMPLIAFSTDILTGFCDETEQDHQATLALMRRVRFDSAFMFAYSERDLTFAAKKLTDNITDAVKKRRLAEIVALQETISAEVFAEHVGRTEQVLVVGSSKRRADQMMGRTDGFKTVILPAGLGAVGETVCVQIERATMATLFAHGV